MKALPVGRIIGGLWLFIGLVFFLVGSLLSLLFWGDDGATWIEKTGVLFQSFLGLFAFITAVFYLLSSRRAYRILLGLAYLLVTGVIFAFFRFLVEIARNPPPPSTRGILFLGILIQFLFIGVPCAFLLLLMHRYGKPENEKKKGSVL